MKEPRIIAIDWSGRSGRDQRRTLWLAEAIDGQLVRLENGRTRAEIVDDLVVEKGRDPHLIVGFDFAFSLPAWYLRERGFAARTLWAALAEEALTPRMRPLGLARWMNSPEPPFWTTGEAHRLLAPEQKFRRTENEVRAPGFQPKSTFQLVGAGQVGRGSLYGMQAHNRLAASGFRIWPFDAPGLPLIVEIFPRLLTGAVTKSRHGDRASYLAALAMPAELRRLAAAGEDAFDAAVSALVMATSVDELLGLRHEPDYALEGKIWQPRHRSIFPEPDPNSASLRARSQPCLHGSSARLPRGVILLRRRPSRCWTSCTGEGCSAARQSGRGTPARPWRPTRRSCHRRALIQSMPSRPISQSATRKEPQGHSAGSKQFLGICNAF